MPPLCDEKRCSRNSRRHGRMSSVTNRPVLLIGEGLENGDDDANESDDNISPDADKSDIRFTLERRQGDDDNDRDNGRNRDDGNRRDRDRSSDDDEEDRRGGRGGDGPGRNRGFREQDDRGGNDGNGEGPGNNRDGDGRGDRGGNRDGNRGDDSDSDDDNDDKDNDGKDGNNNDDGKGDGQENNDDDNSSTSTSLPPPPPPTTTTSAVEAITTTSTTSATTTFVESTTSSASTTSVISISTFTPSPEPTVSATLQTSITSLIALPDEDPSLVTTLTTPISVTTSADNTAGPPPTPTPVFYPVSGSPSSPPPLTPSDPSNTRNKDNNHHGNGRGHKGGLSETSERVLIATGSIGVFIVICFVVWMIYRTIKKSKQPGHTTWISKLMPWRETPKTNPLAFKSLDDPNEPLPAYDADNRNSMEGYGYYEQRKLYPLESGNGVYPPPATLQTETALRQSPGGQPLPVTNYANLYAQPNDQMVDSNDVNSTLRSRMPDPYYNQSEFARQPSDAYNPAQRQVYRASELSSLSSGFGDGDIIIPPPNVRLSKTPAAATRGTAGADGDGYNIRPFSWMSRTGPEQQQRDTMYTTASDRRSRFRSVNSWVDQQKRRLKKAAG